MKNDIDLTVFQLSSAHRRILGIVKKEKKFLRIGKVLVLSVQISKKVKDF